MKKNLLFVGLTWGFLLQLSVSADLVHFENGDRLRGRLIAMENGEMQILPDGSDQPMAADAAAVNNIQFEAPEPFPQVPSHEMWFRDGAYAQVILEAETEDVYIIQFLWGQRMALPRELVDKVRSLEHLRTVDVELGLLKVASGGTSYRIPETVTQAFDGVRIGRGWVAGHPLPDPLPAEFTLWLDVAFPVNLRGRLRILSNSEDPRRPEGILVSFQDTRLALSWVNEHQRRVTHRFEYDEDMDFSESMLAGFRIDQKRGTLTVLLNEEVFQEMDLEGFQIPDAPRILLDAAPDPLTLRQSRLFSGPQDEAERLRRIRTAEIESPGLRTVGGRHLLFPESMRLSGGVWHLQISGWPEELAIPGVHLSVLQHPWQRENDSGANVQLRNGSAFHGRWTGGGPDHLLFTTPWAKSPLQIPTGQLLHWRSTERVNRLPDDHTDSRVVLVDGTVLAGQLRELNDTHFKLEMLWGETVTLPTAELAKIRRVSGRGLVDGLARPDRWRFSSIAPSDREIAPGFTGRLLEFPGLSNQRMSLRLPELPEVFLLELSLEYDAPRPAVHLGFPQEANGQLHHPRFAFRVHRNRMNQQQGRSGHDLFSRWEGDLPDAGSSHHMRFYVDQKLGQIDFWLNGQPVHQWPMMIGLEDFLPRGSTFQIETFANVPMILSRFRIEPVDGHVPEPLDPGGKGRLILRNGDGFLLEAISFSEGQFQITIEAGASFPVPEAVVDTLLLRPVRSPRRILRQGEFVLRTDAGGMRLPVRILSKADGVLEVESRYFEEKLQIPLESIRMLSGR